MKLGKAIKQTRVTLGISQGELAKKVNLSQAYLSQVETDHRMPSMEALENICKALEVPMFFLALKGFEPSDIEADKMEVFEKFFPTMTYMLEGLFLGGKSKKK